MVVGYASILALWASGDLGVVLQIRWWPKSIESFEAFDSTESIELTDFG